MGKPLKILALDLARKTGWATDGAFGLHHFKPDRNESRGMLWTKFKVWLREMLMEHRPDLVVYEKPHHRGGAATEILINFEGRVQEICEEEGLEYASVHSGTLKRVSTGSGRASKEQMLKAARKIWGASVKTDHEADALFLLKYAQQTFAL